MDATGLDAPLTAPGPGYRRMRATAADLVVADVRERILSGEFALGQRIPPERELAAQYGVSMPTVREATRALDAMNLIDVRVGSGTFVVATASGLLADGLSAAVRLDGVTFDELLEVTESVCVDAARRAAGAQVDLSPLRAAADAWTPHLHGGQLADAFRAFIRELAGVSGNRLAAPLAGFLADAQVDFIRAKALDDASWAALAEQLGEDRRAIMTALDEQSASAVEAAVRGYFADARDLYRRV